MSIRPVLLGALLALSLSGTAWAAYDPLDPNRKIEEREVIPTSLSESTYRRLSGIHDLLGESQYTQARAELDKLAGNNLSGYEKALIYQTYGFIDAEQGKPKQAIGWFEKSLAEDALPTAAQQGMIYSLANLYLSQSQWQKAINTMLDWYRYEADPVADSYMLMATAYVQMDQMRTALPYVKMAIAKNDEPRESWYKLQLAIHFELEQYPQAAEHLRSMILYWPDNLSYWEQLYGSYMELGKDDEALATMMLAYQKGLVTEEKKILNLVRFNLFLEIPYEAGVVLERELASGRVTTNQKNLELLLSAWTAADEFDKAIATIDELAPLTADGEYYLQKAQLLNEKGDWPGVIDSAQKAVDRGGLDEPGTAYILMGTAHAELEQYGSARTAFQKAGNSSDSNIRQMASTWIEYVSDRRPN